MSDDTAMQVPLRRNLGVALLTLLASSGTLVCCVLPAVMVALGAGAALAGLVTAVPQLVWLSDHKAGVFGLAFAMLALSGVLLRRARTLPSRNPRLLQPELSVSFWPLATESLPQY